MICVATRPVGAGSILRLCRSLCILTFAAIAAGCAGAPASTQKNDAAQSQASQLQEVHPVMQRADSASRLYPDVPGKGRVILVNIPSFELIAFEDGEPVLRSRVIIGKPSTPTPVMDTETSVVRFRPTWTPTPTMIATGKYTPGTRPPGKRNPLGFLAIRLEPGMLIYLHGTNKPQLFDRDRRALSYGCVRVERWDEVAAWVLGVDVAEVRDFAFGRRTFDMDTEGVPVLIRYETRFPDSDGVVRDWDDIYRRGVYAQAPSNRAIN